MLVVPRRMPRASTDRFGVDCVEEYCDLVDNCTSGSGCMCNHSFSSDLIPFEISPSVCSCNRAIMQPRMLELAHIFRVICVSSGKWLFVCAPCGQYHVTASLPSTNRTTFPALQLRQQHSPGRERLHHFGCHRRGLPQLPSCLPLGLCCQ